MNPSMLLLLPALCPQTPPVAAADPRAAVRAALEAGPAPDGALAVIWKGSVQERGIEQRFEWRFDGLGRFELATEGRLAQRIGFDGTQAFLDDAMSGARELVLGERDQILLFGWVASGQWSAASSSLGLRAGAQAGELELRLPDSPLVASLRVDAQTQRPLAAEWSVAGAAETLSFDAWTESGGRARPRQITFTEASGSTHRYTIESVARAPAAAPHFTPAPPAHRFDAAISPQIEIEKAPTGHLLVHPRIGGKDLGWFLLDTGAGANLLSTPVLAQAGIETFGAERAHGATGVSEAHFCTPGELELGPVALTQPVFLEMDFAFLEPFMGRKIGGVLGYPLLAAGVFELDPGAPSLSAHTSDWKPAEGVRWQRMLAYHALPCIEGSFAGGSGWFSYDSGAGMGGVMFFSPAVERLKLLEGRKTRTAMFGGVGGMKSIAVGEIEWFELGGQRSENVRALFASAKTGIQADPYLVGNLSSRELDGRSLVLDYPGRRIGFVAASATR